MKKIDAKIICFKAFKGNIYFIATDWHEQFNSENFHHASIWWLWDIETIETLNKSDILKTKKILESLHIPYNPQNKEDTIKSLENRLNNIEAELQQSNWKNLILQTEYNLINKVKWTLTNPEPQFMEFKWHKLSVGGRVDVYVDPKNSESYWVDTDFLYS